MSRARAARRPNLTLMEEITSAKARFARVPARKVRYVADLIRGLTVAEAEKQLANVHRPSVVPLVSGVLKSAVANAKELEDLNTEPGALVIGEIYVDAGPMLKRFMARAMGRGVQVRKRMAHVTIKLYAEA
jgi:large subunit ribosomal protein L22